MNSSDKLLVRSEAASENVWPTLIIFIGLQLLSAVVTGREEGAEGIFKVLISGFLVKIIILVTLFRAVGDAKELQQARSI